MSKAEKKQLEAICYAASVLAKKVGADIIWDEHEVTLARMVLPALMKVIDRLDAIVEKLPHTADGVRVAPGMEVYNLSPEGNPMKFIVTGNRCKSAVETNDRAVSKSYSTPEAALAAMDAGRGEG